MDAVCVKVSKFSVRENGAVSSALYSTHAESLESLLNHLRYIHERVVYFKIYGYGRDTLEFISPLERDELHVA